MLICHLNIWFREISREQYSEQIVSDMFNDLKISWCQLCFVLLQKSQISIRIEAIALLFTVEFKNASYLERLLTQNM